MRRPDLSGPIIFALAVSLAALVLTLAALILLATILSQPLSSINPLIIASVTLHALSASMMLRACWRENARWRAGSSSQQTSLDRRSDASAASVLAISGHATTLALLAWTLNDMYQTSNGALTGSPYPVVYTLLGFWILALLSQMVFFWTFLSKRFAKRNVRPRLLMSLPAHWPNPQNNRVFVPPPHQQQSPQRQPSQRQQPQQCGPSRHIRRLSAGWASAALESLRLQKAASAFRLNMTKRSDSAEPLRPGIIRGVAGSSPSPRRSHDSAFDFWDTSAVSTELRQSANADAVGTETHVDAYAGAGSRSQERDQRRLPTIPGSRSCSPARPLDGPFGHTDERRSMMEDEPMLPLSPRGFQEPVMASALKPAPSKPLPALPMILPMYQPSISHHVSLKSMDSIDSMDGRLALHQSRLRKTRPPLVLAGTATRAPSVTSLDSFTHPSRTPRRDSPRNISPRNTSPIFNSSTDHLPPEHHHHHHPPSTELDPTEAHIHPLFRTNSPTPPPSASANTVVTAAPVLLSDIPLAVVRASADRIRDARGLSLASSSSRCSPANSPPLSPSFLSSPLNPNYASGGGAGASAGAGSVSVGSAGGSRPHSRHDSRNSSRSHSRAASRASNRNAIVLRGPAGTVPPTPTSPTFPLVAPPSPVVAVGPGGKVVTRDDLVRTGNFIVFE